jgi:hypothetical protein
MIICLLCSNDVVNDVRKNSKNIGFVEEKTLTIPVSSNGEFPATHWFCSMNVTQEQLETIQNLNINDRVIVEENIPSIFIKKRGLKIIKKS